MDNILDNDGLGLNTTFSEYLKSGYGGILSFTIVLVIILLYMGLTIFLYFYSHSLITMVIMVCIVMVNVSHVLHKYLVWRHNKIEEYEST